MNIPAAHSTDVAEEGLEPTDGVGSLSVGSCDRELPLDERDHSLRDVRVCSMIVTKRLNLPGSTNAMLELRQSHLCSPRPAFTGPRVVVRPQDP